MKTFIKWSGNKSKYLKYILPFIPTYSTYIEPFLGSGALLLNLKPQKWIVNDKNTDLMKCWYHIKKSPHKIISYFKLFAVKFNTLTKFEKIYYCRSITYSIPKLKFTAKRAALFLLMKFCAYMGDIISHNRWYFNGLELNLYNTEYPHFISTKYYDKILKINKYISNCQGLMLNGGYQECLKLAKKDDFVFLDPPYFENHNYQNNYNLHENIDTTFVLDLYNQVKKLDKLGVKWLMTQANTKLVRSVFKEYKISSYNVYRAYTRTYCKELIIRNYL